MPPLRFTVLGCGDAFGSGGRLHTCFYVEAPTFRFLIDCGASALVGMKRFGVDPGALDAIVVSHLHGDHFAGIAFLEREAQIVGRRTRPLHVVGPEGLAERLHAAQEVLFPGSARAPRTFPLTVDAYAARQPLAVGPLVVTAYPVVHTEGTRPHALRVACEGRVVAYSGDTEWTEALVEAADGADLFVCEAYTFEKKVRNHMDYRTLMAHRDALRCRRLLLTHLSDDLLRRLPDLDALCAEDGMDLTI